jgi:hypothetical protein
LLHLIDLGVFGSMRRGRPRPPGPGPTAGDEGDVRIWRVLHADLRCNDPSLEANRQALS